MRPLARALAAPLLALAALFTLAVPYEAQTPLRAGRAEVRQLVEGAVVGTNIDPDGVELQCDLDQRFHLKNVGGSDGAGLCVFASLTHSGIWQHVRPVGDDGGIFQWMRKYPGGGYPQKVDQKIKEICSEKGAEIPDYIQVESRDLDILKLACKTGRMPGVTYGYSPSGRYNGQKISHMVSLVHATDKWFGVLDNNYPKSVEFMDPDTFLRVYTSGSGNGWCVIFLNSPPPPPPRNLR